MKAYKGFNEDMTCRGFEFEEGKTYEHGGKVEPCKSGFHACLDAVECMQYYDPCTSVYHEVEVDGVVKVKDDSAKIAAQKITIGKRIGFAEMVKASIEYIRTTCKAAIGDWSRQAASGDWSRQAASGDWSRQRTTGKNCVMMSAGGSGRACGKVGSWIVLTEWVDGEPNVVAARIDGETVKEDTWYTVRGGKLVEAE